MDMVKMGSFLAELRKEHNMTQSELGDKLGVTNKTVSRWETGNYLPPVEMLEELGNMYGLTINELLSGKHLFGEEYKEMAEMNIKETLKVSAFNMSEKKEYYKTKWLKDHTLTMIIIGICIIVVLIVGIIKCNPIIACSSVLLLAVAHCWRNNSMMAYVEDKLYSGRRE